MTEVPEAPVDLKLPEVGPSTEAEAMVEVSICHTQSSGSANDL